MTRHRSSGLTAAPLLIVVTLTLGACASTSDSADTVIPDTEPASTATTAEPTPTVTPLEPVSEYAALEPGAYVMKPIGNAADAKPWAVVEVDSRAFSHNGVFLIAGGDANFQGMGLWTVAEVPADPCFENGTFVDPGPTVADLAHALAALPLTNGMDPVPVSLGGYDGLYLEISVPTDMNFDDCVNNMFVSLRADDGGLRFHQGPGQVDQLWIVDVEGDRVVVGASYMPETDPDEIDALTEMVESISFTNLPR